jgi:hypothetical protein
MTMTAKYTVFALALFGFGFFFSDAAHADAMRCSSVYATCVANCRQLSNAASRPTCIANCGQYRGGCLRTGCWIVGTQKLCNLGRR